MNMLTPVKAKPWGYRKYRPGRLVINMEDFERAAEVGCWFYYGAVPSAPKHPSVIVNMSFATIRGAIRGKRLWIAQENPQP